MIIPRSFQRINEDVLDVIPRLLDEMKHVVLKERIGILQKLSHMELINLDECDGAP